MCSAAAACCWVDTLDRAASSASKVVQDIWDIYREELRTVPPDLVLALRLAFEKKSVDEFWSVWSAGSKAGLLRAYQRSGSPVSAGLKAFIGRGNLQVRRRRLGSRAAVDGVSSKLSRVSQGDEVDVSWAQFFVNSSLAAVLLLRRRVKSVADVLNSIRQHGFSQGRWDALLGRWKAVCCQVPCGPLRSLEPWVRWVPPDVHGFYRWVFDSLGMHNEFVRQVVTSWRDSGVRCWANWLREDLGSRPYVWFRPDFVLPSPFLVIKNKEAKTSRAPPHRC